MALALLAPGTLARGLETDQYYAWTRPLADSADAINAKVNLEIVRALGTIEGRSASCDGAARAIRKRFELEIFQPIELWALQSSLLDRWPAKDDLDRYRRTNLYAQALAIDIGFWMPISPTIEVDGIRIGTDKLAHMMSSGWNYRNVYLRHRRRGQTPSEAERSAIRYGILEERSINGALTTGVFSRADMEANYDGMIFYLGLCEGEDPLLELRDGAWTVRRPFDIRDYISPEWDESYNAPIYMEHRWRRVRPALRTYCPLLDDPLVRARIVAYRARDRETPSEAIIAELVREGVLHDPARFAIEANCPPETGVTAPVPSDSDGLRAGAEASAGDEGHPDPADLDTLILAAERDTVRRTYIIPGLMLSWPRIVGGSLGWISSRLPRENDCRAVCDLRGPTVQIEPGLAGIQAGIGYARIMGGALGRPTLLQNIYLAVGVKGVLLRTWNGSPLEPESQTLAGVESELTLSRVNLRLGLYRNVGREEDARSWIVGGGFGWGF